jgi:hypothetical protein
VNTARIAALFRALADELDAPDDVTSAPVRREKRKRAPRFPDPPSDYRPSDLDAARAKRLLARGQ